MTMSKSTQTTTKKAAKKTSKKTPKKPAAKKAATATTESKADSKVAPLTAEEKALLESIDDKASKGQLRKATGGKRTTGQSKRDTGEPGAPKGQRRGGKNGQMSLLDAAAAILAGADGEALACKTIVERAADRKLWKTASGKTPANTLYSSILREINSKGKDSRFIKADRGKFALADKD